MLARVIILFFENKDNLIQFMDKQSIYINQTITHLVFL